MGCGRRRPRDDNSTPDDSSQRVNDDSAPTPDDTSPKTTNDSPMRSQNDSSPKQSRSALTEELATNEEIAKIAKINEGIAKINDEIELVLEYHKKIVDVKNRTHQQITLYYKDEDAAAKISGLVASANDARDRIISILKPKRFYNRPEVKDINKAIREYKSNKGNEIAKSLTDADKTTLEQKAGIVMQKSILMQDVFYIRIEKSDKHPNYPEGWKPSEEVINIYITSLYYAPTLATITENNSYNPTRRLAADDIQNNEIMISGALCLLSFVVFHRLHRWWTRKSAREL